MSAFKRNVPDKWGDFSVVTLVSPSLEQLEKRFLENVFEKNITQAAIGAGFLRNSSFPGGAYSVSMLFFGYTVQLSEKQFAVLLLDSINLLRRKSGRLLLRNNKSFSRAAAKISRQSYFTPQHKYNGNMRKLAKSVGFKAGGDTHIFVFNSNEPAFMSEDVKSLVKQKHFLKRVGIGVYSPARHNKPGNYYIVTIIF
ncbi:MAG: hypothetical protein GY765_41710 [bacterium]|nr:hypothetical protein [bacterium]